jgi:hypothetical protein
VSQLGGQAAAPFPFRSCPLCHSFLPSVAGRQASLLVIRWIIIINHPHHHNIDLNELMTLMIFMIFMISAMMTIIAVLCYSTQ